MATVKDLRGWMDHDFRDFRESIQIVNEEFGEDTYFGVIRIGSRSLSIVAGEPQPDHPDGYIDFATSPSKREFGPLTYETWRKILGLIVDAHKSSSC